MRPIWHISSSSGSRRDSAHRCSLSHCSPNTAPLTLLTSASLTLLLCSPVLLLSTSLSLSLTFSDSLSQPHSLSASLALSLPLSQPPSLSVSVSQVLGVDLVLPDISRDSVATLLGLFEPAQFAHPSGDLPGSPYKMFAIVSYIHRMRHYVVWVRSASEPTRWYYYNDLNKNQSPTYSFLQMVSKSREGYHSTTRSSIQSATHSITQALNHPRTQPPTHSVSHSLDHSHARSLAHRLTHTLAQPPSQLKTAPLALRLFKIA